MSASANGVEVSRKRRYSSTSSHHVDLFLLDQSALASSNKRRLLSPALLESQSEDSGDRETPSETRVPLQHPARASLAKLGQVFRQLDVRRGGEPARGLKALLALMPQPAGARFRNRLWHLVPPYDPANAEDRRAERVKKAAAAAFAHEFGGLDVVITTLTAGAGNLARWRRGRDSDEDERDELRGLCLEVLAGLCHADERVAKVVGRNYDLTAFCLRLLTSRKLHEKACQVLELGLMTHEHPVTFDWAAVPNLAEIVRAADGNCFGSVCRLVASTISDLDLYKCRGFLHAQNRERASKGLAEVRDDNHVFLLNLPLFLEKTISQACDLPCVPRFPSSPQQTPGQEELANWMRLIDDSIAQEIGTEDTDAASADDAVLEAERSIVGRTEALWVLALLMAGKHKRAVQARTAQLRLVPRLSDLFEAFFWHSSQSASQSPEMSAKVHFLRVIHAFCEGNPDKHLMLTPIELKELRLIESEQGERPLPLLGSSGQQLREEGANLPKATSTNPRLMPTGTAGLLSKMVDALKQNSFSSGYRLWMCRAVEAFLRGGADRADQTFLVRRGLAEHLAVALTRQHQGGQDRVNAQAAFDLLGELVKFNPAACREMESVFDNSRGGGLLLSDLLTAVNEQLVDSNMFLRAMVLSAEHFSSATEAGDVEAKEMAEQSRIVAYFGNAAHQVKYACKLLSIVHVDRITQENVSCLNTTLIMLMLSRLRGDLSDFLDAVRRAGDGRHEGRAHLENLRRLLSFWLEHYSANKERDCRQLEKSSNISFEYWKESAEAMLVEGDDGDEASLLRYINANSGAQETA